MEEITNIAKAYYANFSDKQKQSVTDLFKRIDTDGDGKISLEEYEQFVKNKFKSISSAQFFKKLDKDENGTLDFEEFITLQYLYTTERVYSCDGCKVFLDGTYFTCVKCFNNVSGNTYDLCCDCYGSRIHHQHSVFLDNYTMLQTRKNKKNKSKSGGALEMVELADFGINATSDVGNIIWWMLDITN
ncbi:uncharacterized protein [Euphorbia lathyris]|uniref:uncharacterized protein n=1 Tax=Euphorbia lathyris TaxID=212925 RepID=UPI00331431D2